MYSKKLTARNSGCIVILVDQSGSMMEPIAKSSVTKKEACAKAVNNVLYDLIFSCASGNMIKDYVEVGLLGYGSSVSSAFQGSLAGRSLVPISEIANSPLRLETDGEGTQHPMWLDPFSEGSAPVHQAFQLAHQWISDWIEKNPDSFPPIVINVTDGEFDNTSLARKEAQKLLELETNDGQLLMLNAHLSNASNQEIMFPSSSNSLPDAYAKYLFDLSSLLPESLVVIAQAIGLENEGIGSRGFVYNANADTLVQFLPLGTTIRLI
jgi:hypothetical protein